MPGRSVGVSATEKVFSPIGKQDFARQHKAAKKVQGSETRKKTNKENVEGKDTQIAVNAETSGIFGQQTHRTILNSFTVKVSFCLKSFSTTCQRAMCCNLLVIGQGCSFPSVTSQIRSVRPTDRPLTMYTEVKSRKSLKGIFV